MSVHAAEPSPSAMRSLSVLIIDDESQSRGSFVDPLRRMGATDIAEAASLAQGRAHARAGGPGDLCIVDLDLPGRGLDLLTDLRNAGWRRVLALSTGSSAFAVRLAFTAGAHGYLLKPGAGATVPPGRTGSEDAATPVIPAPRRPVEGMLPAPSARRLRQLSAREIEVLRLVAAGRSNNAAGEQLQLSALTVKSHLARIARKLGTGDRAHMVVVAMRAGLIC
jgi:DNA-binding NarL/FixJ family response regulator